MRLPRVYPILDTAALSERGCAVETAAEALIEGGARILQFRHKGEYTREAFDQADRVAAICRRAEALYIIDDRADIALMLDAGLHLGQDDLPPGDARRVIGPDRVLGFSTHNAAQVAAAASEPADYLAFGPVFPTRSKEKPDPLVGLEGLRNARAAAARPLVAIGGIARENARQVLEAGADSLAVIRDILPETCDFRSIRARMEEWNRLCQPPATR